MVVDKETHFAPILATERPWEARAPSVECTGMAEMGVRGKLGQRSHGVVDTDAECGTYCAERFDCRVWERRAGAGTACHTFSSNLSSISFTSSS